MQARRLFEILRFGRSGVEMSNRITGLVSETASACSSAVRRGFAMALSRKTGSALSTQAAFLRRPDQQWTSPVVTGPAAQYLRLRVDFRLRRAINLLSERHGEPIDLAHRFRETPAFHARISSNLFSRADAVCRTIFL